MVCLIGLQEKRCLLPPDLKVVGFAPDEISHDEFIKIIRTPIKLESPRYAEQLKQFCERCSYVSGHEGGDESFQALQKRLEEIGLHKKEQNRLFYFSLPPKIFVPMSQGLKKFCYSQRGFSRIIVSSFYHLGPYERLDSVLLTLEVVPSRSKSHLATILKAPGNYRELSIPIGERTRSSALITIWARKWSTIYSC